MDLRNLSLRDIVEDRKRKFYINVKVIYDKCLPDTKRRQLKNCDKIFKETCAARDKNYAHKDDNFKQPDYSSIFEMVEPLKIRLIHCFEICRNSFPDVVTLDFIDYDRDLYRFLHKIDPSKEDELRKKSLFLYKNEQDDTMQDANVMIRKPFHDTEDIKKITDPNEYCVILKDGLTIREGIQERQDFCIKVNVLSNKNIWTKPDMDMVAKIEDFLKKHPDFPYLY